MSLFSVRPFFKAFFALIVIGVVSGCVGRPAENASIRAITPSEAVSINDRAIHDPINLIPKKDDRLTILALSGGGADGAYGVGVLNGWTKTGTRPEFDIVTGVSTGALMSVMAFLGPQYDDLLKMLYLWPGDSDIFRDKGVAGFFSDSIYDNTPLKRLIEKHVTPKLVEEVAREHREGRRLYVATTNLDSSELVVWDMGLLANGGADGRADKVQLFQKILRASAAIPVLFPPVYIKPRRGVQLRQAHVDGGVKAPVLISDFLFERPTKHRDLYIIINGPLTLENAFAAVEPNLRSIAAASVGSLTSELTHQAVYRGYVRAQNTGTSFNLTAIPDDIPILEDPLKFDDEHRKRIYQSGFDEIQKPKFWWKKPPTIKVFDQVARR
ncbi:MAG: patatin-like phospholipase family protein [Ahrensia sp.]|nr:patatin-like phospholipase family protein [Ahrensia sp.]